MAKTTRSLVGGITVLSATGIICKLVGVLYSIPLTWMIGTQGLGVYNAVFPAYNLLLTISSAGLPVAVSRLVARSLAKDDPRGAKSVFKTALLLLLAIGSVATIIMLAGSSFLAAASDQPSSRIGFQVIAPCVVIVCAMSAFRGFMQGQQNMVPTAISQLIEQVGKVFLALPMAYFGSKIGIAYGAAGALLGTAFPDATKAGIRTITLSGVTVDGEKVTDIRAAYDVSALADGKLIKRGKKNFKRVVLK